MNFVDPKTDIAFKKIFGSSEHKIVLIEFLNTVLELEYLIEDVIVINPYQPPKTKGLKETTLDVRATDQKGNQFIVEMQVEKEVGFYKRVIYYSGKAYVQQLPIGGKYHLLKPVIFLGILDFNVFESAQYLSRHLILNSENFEHALKDLEFNFVELPKFNKKENELVDLVDKWIYFFKEAYRLEAVPSSADTEALRQAYEIANQYGWRKEELEVYEYQEIQANRAERIIETARQEGKAEGKAEEKISIAKNLVATGAEVDFIMKVTGLSAEDVEGLKEQ